MERNTETVCIVRLLLKHTDSGHWHGAQPPSPPPYTSCLWPSKLSFTGVTVSQGPDIHMSHTMPGVTIYYFDWVLQGVFSLGLPLKCLSTEKLILASLGVSRRIYVNVDSPNLGFPYFNFLGEVQCKKTPCICFKLDHMCHQPAVNLDTIYSSLQPNQCHVQCVLFVMNDMH